MLSALLLILQAACAIVSLHVLRRQVFVKMAQAGDESATAPAHVLAVWLPLILLTPASAFLFRIDSTVIGAGWFVIAAGTVGAIFGAGAGLMAAGRTDGQISLAPRHVLVWVVTGTAFLLLCATGTVRLGVGQCMLAIAIVLLWVIVPEHTKSTDGNAHAPLSTGLRWAFLLAIGQAVTGGFITGGLVPASGVLVMAHLVAAVAMLAVIAGPVPAINVGGWMGTFGTLLAVGLLSFLTFLQFVPDMWGGVFGDGPSPGLPGASVHVANGFRAYLPEATILILFPFALIAGREVSRRWQVALAGVILLLGAILIGLRAGAV